MTMEENKQLSFSEEALGITDERAGEIFDGVYDTLRDYIQANPDKTFGSYYGDVLSTAYTGDDMLFAMYCLGQIHYAINNPS